MIIRGFDTPGVLVEQKSFGFKMRRGRAAQLNITHGFSVDGGACRISDSNYIKVTLPDKRMYLSVCHNASAYFAFKEHEEGGLNGDETWMHADDLQHPDNNRLEKNVAITPRTPLRRLHSYMRTTDRRYEFGISNARFMSALAGKFPFMRFDFIHNGEYLLKYHGQGMRFGKDQNILGYYPSPGKGAGLVLSLDLDMLSADVSDTDLAIAESLVSLSRLCRMITICLSPSYLDPAFAGMWMENIANRMIYENLSDVQGHGSLVKFSGRPNDIPVYEC